MDSLVDHKTRNATADRLKDKTLPSSEWGGDYNVDPFQKFKNKPDQNGKK